MVAGYSEYYLRPSSKISNLSFQQFHKDQSQTQFLSAGTSYSINQQLSSNHQKAQISRLVIVREVNGEAESNSSKDDDKDKESEKINDGLSHEDLEQIIIEDDSKFSGMDLATLIRKKYDRPYNVQLQKEVPDQEVYDS